MGLKLLHIYILFIASVFGALSIQESHASNSNFPRGAYQLLGEPTNEELVIIPNAFIPRSRSGGVGLNDLFKVRGLDSTNTTRKVALKNFEMFVYNRQGMLLFYSNNIDKGWDGRYKNKYCPLGGYVYLIRYIVFEDTSHPNEDLRYKAAAIEKKGSFLLLE